MTAAVVAPLVLDGLKFALSEIEIFGTKAALDDAIKPRFEQFHETGEASVMEIDPKDYDEYMKTCHDDEKKLLKKLRLVKKSGKDHKHEIHHEKTKGSIKGLLVMVSKGGDSMGIVTCRCTMTFDLHVPGLIWKLPCLQQYKTMPLKEKAFEDLKKNMMNRSLKNIAEKELF